MHLLEQAHYPWLYCKNTDAGKYSKGKLHTALPIEFFNRHHQQIYAILKKAVEEGIIPEFKMMNKGNGEDLEKAQAGALNIAENPSIRLYNNPFTIYLFEGSNLAEISNLCKQLDMLLLDSPPADERHLSIADLPVTKHITYRQEELQEHYVAIATASSEQLLALKQIGESAAEYQQLIALVKTGVPAAPSSSEAELKRRESMLARYYNLNYNRLFQALRFKDAHKQFLAACELLQIDSAELSQQTSTAAWETIIKKKFRLAALQYHPDKFSSYLVAQTIRQQADDLMKLLSDAKALLNEIAQNPAVIDKKKILEQAPSLPEYQYELQEGFDTDPYYYIHLAKQNSYVVLYQNWEFSEDPMVLASTHATDNRIVLYKPQLQAYYGTQRKTIRMTGYEAFYRLFLANALPRRFDQGHFRYIFGEKNEALAVAERWLLEKVLTTPEFIGFMDSHDLISLSIRASRHGVLNIGYNATEVFLYYYLNFPETLYERRIEKILKDEHGFLKSDPYQIIQCILEHPENLAKLEGRALDGLMRHGLSDPRFARYVLAHKELTAKLSHYYVDYTIFRPPNPNLTLNESDEFEKIILRQLYYGNASFIPLLSSPAIQKLKSFIQSNSDKFPTWLEEELDAASDPLHQQLIVSPSQDWGYGEHPLVAKDFIKERFFKNKDIVFLLSKASILDLISSAGIDWYDYLPFADALLRMGEEVQAKIFLGCIIRNLKLSIETEKQSAEKLLAYLQGSHAQTLELKSKAARQQKISLILHDYEIALRDNNKEGLDAHRTKLKDICALELARPVEQRYYESLKNQWFDLVEVLKRGDLSVQTVAAINHIKSCLLTIEGDWRLFSERDKDDKFVLGSQIYHLMQKALANFRDKEDEDQEHLYGINFQEPALVTFKRLFDLYQLLGQEGEFYKDLLSQTGADLSSAPEFRDIKVTDFHPDLIKHHVLRYLDNELAVFCDGQRQHLGYKSKANRFYFNPIKAFGDLYTLYNRLSETKHVEDLLGSAFGKLYETEQRNKGFGVKKYIEIRRHSSMIHSELEREAQGYELHRIIRENYEALSACIDCSPDSLEQQLAYELITGIKKPSLRHFYDGYLHTIPREDEIEALNPYTLHEKLSKLLEFLYYYRDSARYNCLLAAIQNSPILRDHFHLSTESLASNQLAHALILGFQANQPNQAQLRLEAKPTMILQEPILLGQQRASLKEKLRLALIDYDTLLDELEPCIKQLQLKADPQKPATFNKRYIVVAGVARRLHNDLERAKLIFTNSPLSEESCRGFELSCRTAIQNAEKEFKNHRGEFRHLRAITMGFLGVIVGIVGTALALALFPIIIPVAIRLKPPILTHYKNTFFTPPTASLKKLRHFSDSLLNEEGLIDKLVKACV